MSCDLVQRVAHAYQNFTPAKWMINASPNTHEQYLGVTIVVNYLYRENGTAVSVPALTTNGTQHYNVYLKDADVANPADPTYGTVTYGKWVITEGLTPAASYGINRHAH